MTRRPRLSEICAWLVLSNSSACTIANVNIKVIPSSLHMSSISNHLRVTGQGLVVSHLQISSQISVGYRFGSQISVDYRFGSQISADYRFSSQISADYMFSSHSPADYRFNSQIPADTHTNTHS